MKPRAGAHCPQQDRVCCRHDRGQKHHATLPISKTPAPSSLELGRRCVGMSGSGLNQNRGGREGCKETPSLGAPYLAVHQQPDGEGDVQAAFGDF